MAKTSGNNRNGSKVIVSNVTVKDIFNEISMLNPDKTTISSLGSFVSQSSQMVSDAVHKEVLAHVPDGSLAQKILMGTQKTYSDRQLWAISYELQKNKKYTQKLGKELAARKAKAELKKQASRSKLQANKAGSQRILDSIKSNGFKLGDYYNWLKKNKKYRKEFYNKKYSSESAKEFMKS